MNVHVRSSDKLRRIHSDIRGPIYRRAVQMERAGTQVLKLNTGNPASFGFGMPDSVRRALMENADREVAYCDPQGMPEARQALADYHRRQGLRDVAIDDIYIGNGAASWPR